MTQIELVLPPLPTAPLNGVFIHGGGEHRGPSSADSSDGRRIAQDRVLGGNSGNVRERARNGALIRKPVRTMSGRWRSEAQSRHH